MKAMWVSEAYADELKRQGFQPIDSMSVLLTHLSEVHPQQSLAASVL